MITEPEMQSAGRRLCSDARSTLGMGAVSTCRSEPWFVQWNAERSVVSLRTDVLLPLCDRRIPLTVWVPVVLSSSVHGGRHVRFSSEEFAFADVSHCVHP